MLEAVFFGSDTQLYIDHRMRIAGYDFEAPLFTREALALIAQYSEGIPRNINNLCFNSLSLGCALKRKPIDGDIVREVVADLDLDRWRRKSSLAVRPEERGSQEAPAFLSAASAPSMLAGWVPKFARCRRGPSRHWRECSSQAVVGWPKGCRAGESWDRAASRCQVSIFDQSRTVTPARRRAGDNVVPSLPVAGLQPIRLPVAGAEWLAAQR